MGKPNISDALVSAVAIRTCNNDGCSWENQPDPVKQLMRKSAKACLTAYFQLVEQAPPVPHPTRDEFQVVVQHPPVVHFARRNGRTTAQLTALVAALQLYPSRNKQLLQANKVCAGVARLAEQLLAERATEVSHG